MDHKQHSADLTLIALLWEMKENGTRPKTEPADSDISEITTLQSETSVFDDKHVEYYWSLL